MENIFELLQRYKNANIGLSFEQERELIAKYIYGSMLNSVGNGKKYIFAYG